MLRVIIFLCLAVGTWSLRAQVVEDFESEVLGTTPDTYSPSWEGNVEFFTLVTENSSQVLRSNAGQLGLAAGYYISTASSVMDDTVWEFYLNLKFATSGANYIQVFLVADNSNPINVSNGYFVRIGETADRIALYPIVSGTAGSAILASADGVVNSSTNNPYKIRVTRDAIGNWTLEYDKGVTGTYLSVGTALNDEVLTTSHFIIYIQQSTAVSAANNHFFDDIFVGQDEQGPLISSVSAILSNSVEVQFNEPLDPTTAENSANYTLSGGATVTTATLDGSDPSIIHLTTSTLVNGQSYTLTVNNVEDLSQNVITPNSTVDFTYLIISVAGYRDMVINEFLSDPGEESQLPNTDFVELYNPTDKYYNLSGWKLFDAVSASAAFPSYILAPQEYVIICDEEFVPDFEEFGSVIGLPTIPAFNNSNDEIRLYDQAELLIDQVVYDAVADEGISNEQVNPSLVCSGIFNFRPSVNEIGGTPGTQNSVFMIVPDNFGPSVTRARAISSDSIRIDFDEAINGALVGTAEFVINPSVGVLSQYYLPAYGSSVFIKLTSSIILNAPYTVTVSAISDCSGNTIDENFGTFVLGESPEQGDILLSEVLFNPRTNGVDFVEIFNPSSTINYELRGWKLATIDKGIVSSPKELGAEGQVIKPREFLAFTTKPTVLATEYPKGNSTQYVGLASLPSYNDDADTVLLLNENDEVIQRFDYNEDFHYALLESEDGVSLERISYEKEVNDPNNWRSAASTVGFATPGRPNSQSKEFAAKSGKLSIDPKVFLPGNTGTGRDFTTINYQLSQGGQFANIMIYDQQGRPVKQLANGASLATEGFFRWDGTTDRGGMARMGYYLIVFELYSGTGKTQTLKETVVVGRDF